MPDLSPAACRTAWLSDADVLDGVMGTISNHLGMHREIEEPWRAT
jgi:hypothetical protein